ncbi:hypothetical protein BIV57_17740 [Mangrovactinospora gilvigrisea]|uniref:HTH tetR-type domain-containing protein n=1 Tax=Mangrovactinospora gilvigrisea TaxID=1428644 RepID=A0A1J7BRT8_9ACTN|nr:TetR/AcrR family transcriptional regulator [Mangrovactinospora gilvigrisea]OIV36169.1 hypothetical protein BIV57_17740 [Mangrovactinospora gilvigrisea]
MTAAPTRALARAAVSTAILDSARRHLAESGPAALSLRAVARDIGMASSAVYRYFPSRDRLLERLIADAHDAMSAAAEAAETAVPRDDLPGRWTAVLTAVHGWARAHPHEYALVYGTPVPGYRPPDMTMDDAGRVGLLIVRILQDAARAGRLHLDALRAATAEAPPSDHLRHELDMLTAEVLGAAEAAENPVPPEAVAAAVAAWTHLFGTVNFSVFGQYDSLFCDSDAYVAFSARQFAALLGLT